MLLMLTDNICTSQDLCNGTNATLHAVVFAPGETIPNVGVE